MRVALHACQGDHTLDETVDQGAVPLDVLVLHEVVVKVGVELVGHGEIDTNNGSPYSSASRCTAAFRALLFPKFQSRCLQKAITDCEAAPQSFSEPCNSLYPPQTPCPNAPGTAGPCVDARLSSFHTHSGPSDASCFKTLIPHGLTNPPRRNEIQYSPTTI